MRKGVVSLWIIRTHSLSNLDIQSGVLPSSGHIGTSADDWIGIFPLLSSFLLQANFLTGSELSAPGCLQSARSALISAGVSMLTVAAFKFELWAQHQRLEAANFWTLSMYFEPATCQASLAAAHPSLQRSHHIKHPHLGLKTIILFSFMRRYKLGNKRMRRSSQA